MVCAYYSDNLEKRNKCYLPVYKNEKYCIFHSPAVEDKATEFHRELSKLIDAVECDKSKKYHNFSGFFFPKTITGVVALVFSKPVIFYETHFTGEICFTGCSFRESVDFTLSEFSGEVDFSDTKFHGFAVFSKIQFMEVAVFSATVFYQSVDFTGTRFLKNVDYHLSDFISSSKFNEVVFSNQCDFSNAKFGGEVTFNKARFLNYSNFFETVFLSNCYFSETEIIGEITFQKVRFIGSADFQNAHFVETADFRNTKFTASGRFSGVAFEKNAFFNESQFLLLADFREAVFSGVADFQLSEFSGYASFIQVVFRNHANFCKCKFLLNTSFDKTSFLSVGDFFDAEFHGLLMISDSYHQFINRLNSKGVNFEGSVIEEVNFWGVKRLENYSFRNAFLLSVNLSDKEIINCDFTGAVMDAVRTRGWKPDQKTIDNTQYIYTDYYVKTDNDQQPDKGHKLYCPLDESRVPAAGNFGVGSNSEFHIAIYLKERYKWTRSIAVPIPIRTAIVNYIHFFTNFIAVTEGIDCEVFTKKEGDKIRVEFLTETLEAKREIECFFKDYLLKANEKEIANLTVSVSDRSKATAIEKKLLEIELKNQISNLQTIVSFTTELLESEKEKVRLLSFQKSMQMPDGLLQASRRKTENLLVLKADIKGFSTLMEKGRGEEVTNKLSEIVARLAQHCKYYKVKDGDSILILHYDAQYLVKTADRIIDDLYEHPEKPKLRVAIDFGPVIYEESGDVFNLQGGQTLRIAARIEPFVTPGEIWVTELARSLLEAQAGKYRAVELCEEDMRGLEYKNGTFNVKKKGSAEPDLWLKLYKIRSING